MPKGDPDELFPVNRNPQTLLFTLQRCNEITDDGLYHLRNVFKVLPNLKGVHLDFNG